MFLIKKSLKEKVQKLVQNERFKERKKCNEEFKKKEIDLVKIQTKEIEDLKKLHRKEVERIEDEFKSELEEKQSKREYQLKKQIKRKNEEIKDLKTDLKKLLTFTKKAEKSLRVTLNLRREMSVVFDSLKGFQNLIQNNSAGILANLNKLSHMLDFESSRITGKKEKQLIDFLVDADDESEDVNEIERRLDSGLNEINVQEGEIVKN